MGELLDGKNVADYIDPDIFEKLEALEREEELREAAGVYDEEVDDLDSEEEENQKLAEEIRKKKKIRLQENREKKRRNYPTLPRKASLRLGKFGKPKKKSEGNDEDDAMEYNIDGDLEMMDTDSTRARSAIRKNRKRKHEASVLASTTRAHSSSKIPRDQSGILDPKKRAKVRKITKIAQRKMNQFGKAGESDSRPFKPAGGRPPRPVGFP